MTTQAETHVKAGQSHQTERPDTLGSVILLSHLKSMGCKGLAVNFSKPGSNNFNRLGEKYANRGFTDQ